MCLAKLLHHELQTVGKPTRRQQDDSTPREGSADAMRPSHYYLEVGDERSAKALDAWRSVHDLFELKGWIERKLNQIWKLDSASKS